ncbi:MAG: hypothetical protein JXB35_10520 [Anaerolineae bacterium]|nr:hypothetical protein [Anaerolineae bacterium]
MKRYKYGDYEFLDSEDQFTPEEVRRQLAAYFPEVAEARIEETVGDDGITQVSFVKRAGRKGYCQSIRPTLCAALIVCLQNIPPLEVPGISLLLELENASAEEIVNRQQEIAEALQHLDLLVINTERLVEKCQQLHPTPTQNAIPGF